MALLGCHIPPSQCPNYGYCFIEQLQRKDSIEAIRSRIRSLPADSFEAHVFQGSDTPFIPYRLLRPLSIQGGVKYPLVLLFHSSGTPVGSDNLSHLTVPAKFWAQPGIRQKYPAFVLAPQFPKRSSNYIPTTNPRILSSQPDPALDLVLQLVDSLKKVLPIDEQRIYVMGFSMGASTTINAIEKRPDLFAAAVSMSGIPSFNHTQALAQIPLWLIHGDADTENPISSDSLLFKQLKLQGDRQIRYWRVEKMGHEIDGDLLKGDEIPKWLFSKHKS
jgi:predicted peptidase